MKNNSIYRNFALFLNVLFSVSFFQYVKTTHKEVGDFQDNNQSYQNLPGKDKLTVAMFTNNYFPFIGGVPISINRLAKGLRKEGHEVYIFAPEYPGINQDNDTFILRCKLLVYHKTKIFDFPIVNIFSPKIEKEFTACNFDVIHVHHPFWMGRKGLKLGKKYHIPVVFTYHTRLDYYYHYLPFLKLLFKNVISHKMVNKFAQKCSAVFAPTTTAKKYLSNIGVSNETAVLPTGIDFDNFESIDAQKAQKIRDLFVNPNEILLCSVSRLSREKNISFLIEAIQYIKKNTTIPFTYIIIGDGPEKANLITTIKECYLQDTIQLVGSVEPEEINAYYQASDLFLFSSKSETQGMVLLEAMAGECPVVAVSSTGIDDVIRDGYNGYKTREDIEKWSEKVIDLLENQDKLRGMSQNARHFSESFSVEVMAAKAAVVYQEAIKDTFNKHLKASRSKKESKEG